MPFNAKFLTKVIIYGGAPIAIGYFLTQATLSNAKTLEAQLDKELKEKNPIEYEKIKENNKAAIEALFANIPKKEPTQQNKK